MNQLLPDKSLGFEIKKDDKPVRRFSFSFAKKKVAELLDPSSMIDPIAEFDQESKDLEISSHREKSKSDISHADVAIIETLFLNARLLLENEEYALASHLLREILSLDSQSAEAASWLVNALKKTNRWEEAEACCQQLVVLQKNYRVTKALADLQYRRQADGEARENYFVALSLMTYEGPDLYEIFKNLGNIAVREGDFEGAEEYYNKAYTLMPGSDTLLVNYGTLAVQQGDYEKAKDRFVGALNANPQNDKAWVGQALLNEQRGDIELALGNVEKALDCNPCNTTALQLLARWSFQSRDFSHITECLQIYLSKVSDDCEMSLLLSKILIVQRKEQLAMLELERLLLWNPVHEEALQLFNEVRAQKRD